MDGGNIKLEKKNVIHNVIIIYNDNVQEFFEVLRVIDKGVVVGREINGEFFDCGFISHQTIKKIKKIQLTAPI